MSVATRRAHDMMRQYFWTEWLIRTGYSAILLSQGLPGWANLQIAFHGTFPPIREPQVSRIQGEMGQRRVELRFRLPQVRYHPG